MVKTNKSILKRMRITKARKILRSGSGINHFQAKKSRRSQLRKKRSVGLRKEQARMIKSYLHH